jgi:hypothetical protein
MEGPYEATGKEGKTFKMEEPMSKEEMEEEKLKAKAQELLFQVLGFRLPEWRKFLKSRTKNH